MGGFLDGECAAGPTELPRGARGRHHSAQKLSGDFVEEAIPDPIPNSEVKLLRADGTAWGICVGE